MVQELNYESNFAAMFQTSRQGVNAYSPATPGIHNLPPFGYGPQHTTQPLPYGTGGGPGDYGPYPSADTGPTGNMPQSSGSPSPTSWSMYPQPQTSTSRHTPTAMDEWSAAHGQTFGSSNGVTQNNAQSSSFASYRPSSIPSHFSNMAPHDPLTYVQGTSNAGVGGSLVGGVAPTNQSPSPNSGSSHQGGATGMGSSPISRHSRGPYEWMKRPSYPSGPATGKTRTKDKYRIVYSEYQKVELEKEYLYSKYITIQRKAELARSIGLSERQVKIWFQNRRAKERKQKRKREDAMAGVQSPEAQSGSDAKDIEPIKVEPSQEYMNPQVHMHHHHHHLTSAV